MTRAQRGPGRTFSLCDGSADFYSSVDSIVLAGLQTFGSAIEIVSSAQVSLTTMRVQVLIELVLLYRETLGYQSIFLFQITLASLVAIQGHADILAGPPEIALATATGQIGLDVGECELVHGGGTERHLELALIFIEVTCVPASHGRATDLFVAAVLRAPKTDN